MSDLFDVDAFIEYHVGDCSCEHGHECQSCTMKHELKKEIKELRTRVAEEERMKDAAVVQADTFKTAWEELKKRVAELTENLLQKEIEINKLNDEVNAWVEANRRTRDGDLISQKLLYDCKFELQRKANIEVLHESEIKELRTRVAELTKKGENLCTSHGLLLCAHDTLKKKNEELQNRLSTLEAVIKHYEEENDKLESKLSTLKEHHDCLKHNYRILDEKREVGIDYATKEIDKLTMRLSTLLKASEGMEKALELLINHTMDCEEDIDKLSGMGNDSGSGSSEYVCAAKQALADFRALKETE